MSEENKNETTEEAMETQASETEVAVAENDSEVEAAAPDLARGDSPDFKWYVTHVLSGYEGRVSKTLKERIMNHNMAEYFSEILVPEETVVANVNGKKRNIKKKFFPGYMLIKMIMTDKAWHLVKNTDKITGFVGGSSVKPQPISDEEAAFMLGQAKDGAAKKARSSVAYSTGDSVKVVEDNKNDGYVERIISVTDKVYSAN